MNKGTIMTIGRNKATVFTQDCRVRRVDWHPGMKIGQVIPLDQTEPVRTTRSRRPYLVPALVSASLVLVLAVVLLLGGVFTNPVYATISVDVNPSVEFDLNRDLDVIAMRAINDDARQLMQDHDLTGLDWQEALRQWVQILKSQPELQVQNMLISAVLPEGAEDLKTQLVNMEMTQNQGELAEVQVRVIYSHDSDIGQTAALNGLSVGRQMLLNQAKSQHADEDATTIAQGRLDELMGRFLQKGERDQTRLTEHSTQPLSEPSGSTRGPQATEPGRETNRETSRDISGSTAGSQETNRETSRDTSGSTAGSQETIRETSQTPATSGSGPSGPQQTTHTADPGNGPGRG